MAILIPALCLCVVVVYFLPPVHDRLAWRVDEAVLRLRYSLNPPAQQVFVPQEGQAAPAAPATALPTATSTLPPATPTAAQAGPVSTPAPSPTPTATPLPLPPSVDLKGVVYEDQHGRWNYCAPANLAMALSYWGWQGDRDVVGPALKPEEKDKNVMPYEMVDYVETQTNLKVFERVGGDLDLLKRFLAAGYPVLVEKGTYLRDLTGVVSWMGHYQVITGYDEASQQFTAQDSFVKPDHPVPYDEMIDGWRAFNYTYLIIFPPEKEAEVQALLGADADETTNYQNAALKASNEVYGLAGIDQYFAWFNRGTNLVKLQDFAGASAAYDEAFKVYPTIPESERPWRMLWYQTGPYFAYYYAQRYYDLLYLSDGTLSAMQGDKNLEESYYWRGMARAALGETQAAVEDFQLALKYHPGFGPALQQLQVLGAQP
jgi:tetratricopeptide (TPR) repeat protein